MTFLLFLLLLLMHVAVSFAIDVGIDSGHGAVAAAVGITSSGGVGSDKDAPGVHNHTVHGALAGGADALNLLYCKYM